MYAFFFLSIYICMLHVFFLYGRLVLPYYARKSFAWSVRARLFAGVCDACPLEGRFVGVGVCSLLRCSPAAAATGSDASTCSSQLLVQSPEGDALAAAGGGAAWGCFECVVPFSVRGHGDGRVGVGLLQRAGLQHCRVGHAVRSSVAVQCNVVGARICQPRCHSIEHLLAQLLLPVDLVVVGICLDHIKNITVVTAVTVQKRRHVFIFYVFVFIYSAPNDSTC